MTRVRGGCRTLQRGKGNKLMTETTWSIKRGCSRRRERMLGTEEKKIGRCPEGESPR